MIQFNVTAHDSTLGVCSESEQWSVLISCRPWDLRLLPCHREGRSLSGTVPTRSRRCDSFKAAPRDTCLPRSNCWHAASQVLQSLSPSPAALHLGLTGCSVEISWAKTLDVLPDHTAPVPSSAAGFSEPRVSLGSSLTCPAGPFPLSPTFHHLHHYMQRRHQEGSSAQSDAQGML